MITVVILLKDAHEDSQKRCIVYLALLAFMYSVLVFCSYVLFMCSILCTCDSCGHYLCSHCSLLSACLLGFFFCCRKIYAGDGIIHITLRCVLTNVNTSKGNTSDLDLKSQSLKMRQERGWDWDWKWLHPVLYNAEEERIKVEMHRHDSGGALSK